MTEHCPCATAAAAALSGLGRCDVGRRDGGRQRWPSGDESSAGPISRVRIQGIARRVVSAEWVSPVTPERSGGAPSPGYSTNENATGGRLIVFLVDQPNIRFGGCGGHPCRPSTASWTVFSPRIAWRPSASARLRRRTPFTADRERAKQVIARMVGQGGARNLGLYQISLSEAIARCSGAIPSSSIT